MLGKIGGFLFHRLTGVAVIAVGVLGGPLGAAVIGAKASAVTYVVGLVLNQLGAHIATVGVPTVLNPSK